MQRKSFIYLLAALALLSSLLPVSVAAQKETPDAAPDLFQIETLPASAAGAGSMPAGMLAPNDIPFFYETESNDTPATANALPGASAVALGNIWPNGDHDYYSFTGNAGDRVYAATMTSFAAGDQDSVLTLFASDGTTVIEEDNNDGSFGGTSSSIAGATLPADGTYYLRVRANSATVSMRPYHLYLTVQSGAPTPETEPNNLTDSGQALPASGWVSGAINPASDNDVFNMTLNAGDTVFLSLDLDPERDGGTSWNGRVGLGAFGGPSQILVVNDTNTTSPNSEAFFFTVKDAGDYFVYVDHPTAGSGDPAFTYHLSVAVFPAVPATGACTTYTSSDVPVTIGDGPPNFVQSTLTVPGNPRIADIDVSIELTHTFMTDLDVALMAPGGNQVMLFNDRGVNTQQGMNMTLDDEAAIPSNTYTVSSGMIYQPQPAYRLDWLDYQDAGGTWTLQVWDDTNLDGGTLLGWSITLCEPPPPPSCAVGYEQVTLFSSDFEADDGGFTTSGTNIDWAWGSPTAEPINSCSSGSNCWVTNLDGNYSNSSNQNLHLPNIDLSAFSGPVILNWSQKHQIENATFDQAFLQVQQVGGGNPTQPWQWLGPTMSNQLVGGSPTNATVRQSAGWSHRWADLSSYAGQEIEAWFNLTSDSSVSYGGLAVDDVTVTACAPVAADPPNIYVDPLDLSSTQAPDTVVTQSLVISNTGGSDLNWEIEEAPAVAVPLSATPAESSALSASIPTGPANETVDNVEPVVGHSPGPLTTFTWPEAVLHDNGPFVTHPGAGPGGSDLSTVQNISLSMTLLGSNVSASGGFRMADDFVVTSPDGWTVDAITFYAYQTGSTTSSTFNLVNYQIWDGPPNDAGSSIVFGDTATNRLLSTGWTNAYRDSETLPGDTSRPIMFVTGSGGFHLPAGSYWLDWQLGGTLASGPWQIPITILGQTTTGNALHFQPPNWINWMDATAQAAQGAPFTIEGTEGGEPGCELPADVPWLSVNPNNGTTAPGDADTVDVVFDSTGLAPGTYTANLCIGSNDPDPGPGNQTELVIVPVELVVEAVAAPPNIDVDPLSLSSSQAPDTVVTQSLVISNTGGSDLNWEIEEEDTTSVAGLPFAGGPAAEPAISPAGSVVGLSDFAESNVQYPAGPVTTSSPAGATLLFDQQPNQVNGLFSDSDCGLCVTGQQTIAENFAFGSEVTISQIVIWGGYYPANTPMEPDAIRVLFHEDVAGLPGAVVYDESNVAYTREQTGVILSGANEWKYTITLATPVTLPAGTHWLELFNNTAGNPDNFFWETGNLSALNGIPNNSYAQQTPGVNWLDGSPAADNALQLWGDVGSGGGGDCTVPSDVSWLSVTPDNGTTAPGDADTVDVVFDSTGLAPGTYTANLCIGSNDPDPGPGNQTELVIVPVELVVEAVAAPPNIDVDPLSLSSSQAPDTVVTQSLVISNTGGSDLNWEIEEEDTTSVAGLPFAGGPAAEPAISPAGSVVGLSDFAESNVQYPAGPVTTSSPAGATLLFDQQPNQVNGLFSDSDCGLCVTGQQTIAENFAFGSEVTISQIVIWGGYYPTNTPMEPDAIRVLFHEDAAGLPGAVVYDESNVAYTREQTGVILSGANEWKYTITLATPVTLPAGTHWLELFNNTAGNPDNFFWETGNLSALNGIPNNSYAQQTPGVNWLDGSPAADNALQLWGDVGSGGGGDCTVPSDVSWLSVTPDNGTTAPGDADTVDVVFDSTGLAPGTYTANLCIGSNDPDPGPGNQTELVIVPVELVVEAVAAPPNIDVDPLSLSSSQAPDTVVTQSLVISNTGGSDLNWEIEEEDTTSVAGLPFAGGPAAEPAISPAGSVVGLSDFAESNVQYPAGPVTTSSPAGATLLFDQQPNQVNGLFSDSDCGLCVTGQQTIAENFAFGSEVTISQIVIWGGYYPTNTPMEPDAIRVLFHEDAAGLPGAVVYDESNVAYTREQTGVILSGANEWKYTITLATPVTLPAGTHWLELFNNTAGNPDNFFWETGNLSALNGIPNNSFAQQTPGVNWLDGSPAADNALQLWGDVGSGGGGDCTVPSDVSWLSVTPDNGTTAPGDADTVDVVFDSTGLAPGTYAANLCIGSNDPDPGPGNQTELVIVPVELVVEAVAAPPNIDVSPLSLSSTQPTNTSTQQTLNVANTGGGTLTWDIDEEDTTLLPIDLPAVLTPQPAAEVVGTPEGPAPAAQGQAALWRGPAAVLYDNGPQVTHPGGGAGGADASALQTALGLSTYGFGHAVSSGFRMADDFTVPAGGWNVNTITFFAYQTGSGTTSTINAVNVRIWDGPPNAGGTVIWGDTTTNRLASSAWSNAYRVLDTALTNNQRPIMADVATIGTFLPAGTYWVDWQTGGTLASGPWAHPVSIVGQVAKPGANGLQFDPTLGVWNPLNDTGANAVQDLPFIIEGTAGGSQQPCVSVSDIPWLSLSPDNGSNAGGTDTDVTVTFNSTGLANGTYTGNLCVTSNDPDAGPGNGTELVIVPVTLIVGDPTAVTLDGLSAAPLPAAGLPVAALPAAIGLALGAAYALRRRQ